MAEAIDYIGETDLKIPVESDTLNTISIND